jgi:PAS domain S-box-containing protein
MLMSAVRPDAGIANWLGSTEHDSAQHLAAIVENSDDAIVSKDLDGKILSWNDAATQMYGYTAEEALGQPIDIVIPEDPERRQEELDIRARIARGARIQHYETIRRRKDGTLLEVSLSISQVRPDVHVNMDDKHAPVLLLPRLRPEAADAISRRNPPRGPAPRCSHSRYRRRRSPGGNPGQAAPGPIR